MLKKLLKRRNTHAYGVAYLRLNIPERLPAGARWGASVTLENRGAKIWDRHESEGKRTDLIVLWDGQVTGTHQMPRAQVYPGEKITIHFPLSVPSTPGQHELVLDLVEQNVTTFADQGVKTYRQKIYAESIPVNRSTKLYTQSAKLNPWYYQPTQGINCGREGSTFPVFVSRAKGCHLWDLEGRQYIDYVMGWGCALLGYAEERVQQAIISVMDSGAVVPFPHPLEMEVAEILTEDIPCAEMVVFGKNGSDVCTVAARLARLFTGKKKILFSGYHGWQDWWVEQAGFAGSGVPDRAERLIYPFKFNNIEDFMRLFEEHRTDVAAVMLEPSGQTENADGPMQDADREFLSAIKIETRRSGALLIYDEIITGFRYPEGSVQKALGVIPDLTCLGKALSAGMPLSALVGRADIFRKCMENTHYGPTFKGEIYSFAAAKAALQIYREEPVATHVWDYGTELKKAISALCKEVGLSAECLGPPFRMAVVFDEPNPERLQMKRTLYQQELLKAGVVTYNGIMLPSYAHDEKAFESTVDAIGSALDCVALAEKKDDFHRYIEIPLL